MESRFLLQDDGKVKCLRGRRYHAKKSRPTASSSSSFSARVKHSKLYSKVAEFACSACLSCFCCPLSIAWCCIKIPCEIGWQATRRATHWVCCGSKKRIVAEYSSFSDIDSHSITCKSRTCGEEEDQHKIAEKRA